MFLNRIEYIMNQHSNCKKQEKEINYNNILENIKLLWKKWELHKLKIEQRNVS